MEKEYKKYVLVAGGILLFAIIVWFAIDPQIRKNSQNLYENNPSLETQRDERSINPQNTEPSEESVTEWYDRNSPPPGLVPEHENAEEITPTL